MKCCLMIGLALTVLCSASTLAYARPPTVMNSPGYDRRLQESRSQLGSPTTTEPASAPAVKSKRSKKKHPN